MTFSRWMSLAIVPIVLAACADDTSNAGAGPGTPDDAYFAFADRRCLRFKESAGDPDSVSMEMALDTKSVDNVRTFHLKLRRNGYISEELWVEVTADSLLLHRRRATFHTLSSSLSDPYHNVDTTITFTPPLVLLRKEMALGETVTSSAEARVAGGDKTELVPAELHVTPTRTDTIDAAGAPVEATLYLVGRSMNGGADIVDKLWFLPSSGIVKLDPSGDTIDAATLTSAGAMGEGETCN